MQVPLRSCRRGLVGGDAGTGQRRTSRVAQKCGGAHQLLYGLDGDIGNQIEVLVNVRDGEPGEFSGCGDHQVWG